jgi:hypothetical protein
VRGITPEVLRAQGCFKGRCQLNYSPDLKDRHEELIAKTKYEAINPMELGEDEWNAAVGNDIRGELLELARSEGPGKVIDFLAGFGSEIRILI